MTKQSPPNVAVWFEIPVTDMERAKAFYNTVLQTELRDDNTGPNPMAIFPAAENSGVAGHLYPGKPSSADSGNTIHLAAPDPLEDALVRVRENGGAVLSEVITIPAGRFAYCRDPDGNSVGLFGR
ncbi:MAG: VOC family protein [Bauldia sp.]|uniref:VOC family protein n=1 Tax=Bauldia sp. TaxID=2575872 RepID=UPI001DB66141|nr:VOC family protein [Bauldia sp.]MCB1496115.1 VOC family protein [Bauldia sp.]